MHYVANSMYWAKEGNLENMKSTMIYGAHPDDSKHNPEKYMNNPAALKTWLESRLPLLMTAFNADIKTLFGE